MSEIVVQTTVVQAVVEDSDVQVVVTANPVSTVEVITPGPQGPVGATGAGGALGHYGAFIDNTTQVGPQVATPVAIGIATEDNGITLADAGRLVIAVPGTYKMTFSIQLQNAGNDAHYADIWLRYNGQNYPDSNTRFYVPARKSTNQLGFTVATVDFIGTSMAVNDYVELFWVTDSPNVTIQTLPSYDGVPGTPGVIVNLSQVMYTQVGPVGPQGPQGEQGVPGPNTIAGYGFNISSVQNGDVLAFSASEWVNQAPAALTDGGNF